MLQRKGNSVLEYSILAALVIASILLMNSFIKRRYQGFLRASANRMGEQFSTSGETIKTEQTLANDQVVTTQVLGDELPNGVYTSNVNKGGEITAVVQTKSESLKKEKARADEYSTDALSSNITDPDLPE